jgi:zinc protease
MGYHAPNLKSHDAHPLAVLSFILAGGKSSRLHRELVDRRQLALHVGIDYDPLSVDPSLFLLSAKAMPGNKPSVVEQSLDQEIEKIKKIKVGASELQRAKKQIESGWILGQDSLFGRAILLGQYELSVGQKALDDYLPKILSVTAEDVQRVAQAYLSKDRRTVGTLLPTALEPQQAAGPRTAAPLREKGKRRPA